MSRDITYKIPEIKFGVPALVLAPMEGYTDAPMRALMTERGGFNFCVSEFSRVSQEVLTARFFYRAIPELSQNSVTTAGTPVQIQILGGNAKRMAASALQAYKAGATAIDINFGCPAPTVNRHDGGAALLKSPERIFEIVSAVRQSLPIDVPVSAKLRLGWENEDEVYKNAEMAQKASASWITIHGRTKIQGYRPPAFWKPIGEVRKSLSIPVVANGDIWNISDFIKCREETGCEHFMLGRGALADPNLPLQLQTFLNPSHDQKLSAKLNEPYKPFDTYKPFETHKNLDPQQLKTFWHGLIMRFNFICQTHENNSSYSLSRTKQWLKTAHLKNPLPFFDDIKVLTRTEDILNYLSPL